MIARSSWAVLPLALMITRPRAGAAGDQARAKSKSETAAKRRVLKAEDLVYKGSFAPPKSAQGISTSYTHIGLGMRIVGGERRFFAGAGPDDAGVYEMNFPGLAKVGQKNSWPNARVVKWWGNIAQGKCVVANKENAVHKHGLFWYEPTRRLYWTYGSVYN